MKNIFLFSRLVLCILFIGVLVSCKKSFLEIVPKGSQVAETTNDYDLLMSDPHFANIDCSVIIPLGDEVAAVTPYFTNAELRTQRLFRWDAVIYEPEEDAPELGIMQTIYSYNKIINEVMGSSGGTEQQKKEIQAEAKAGRAWTYFLLINYYGKPYNEVTAATDPGFPIVKEADINEVKFSRATVKEVYDFIIDDLIEAISVLPSQITHRRRMSGIAANILLAKVYMTMGKFEEALPLLNSAFTGISSSDVPLQLYNYNIVFQPDGLFQPISSMGPNSPYAWVNSEVVFMKETYNVWAFWYDELVLSPQASSLYKSSDLRLKFYSAASYFGDIYPLSMLRRIGRGNSEIGVILPEFYLLLAECKARLNDLPGAIANVETLRKNRMPEEDAPVPSSITGNKEALVKFILEERIREFALQGYRWLDMRRLSVDPEYNLTVNYTHKVYDLSGNETETITLTPERLTLQFPQKIMNQNPGMKNNP